MRGPVVLGLDFGGSKIAAAVCDLDGNRLADTVVPTAPLDGAQVNLHRGITAASVLLGSLGGPRLVAVGVSTFGIPSDRGVELAPAIPGWDSLRLDLELNRAFDGVPIALATDVKAAAQAESETGALVGCDPGLYLNLGTGLAVAIVADGTVITGRHGASGEIGYGLRYLADVAQPSGARIMLEEAVSGMALANLASTIAGRLVSAEQVFTEAVGDPRWDHLIADFVAELAFHLVNLTIAIDPARIVVGGGMTAAWDLLHGGLRRALDAAVPYPPELTLARFPFDAPLRGAMSLGVAAARGRTVTVAEPAVSL
ncbi:glucokinase [Nakamurella sp. UYEF19]|uniref:ROK family protein n=1 Tax=Nakamurella sp. UYEF19 TaxID=1756392 RepID=UPI003396C50B